MNNRHGNRIESNRIESNRIELNEARQRRGALSRRRAAPLGASAGGGGGAARDRVHGVHRGASRGRPPLLAVEPPAPRLRAHRFPLTTITYDAPSEPWGRQTAGSPVVVTAHR